MKFISLVLLIALLSIPIHELVHIVQIGLDDRVKYSHLGVLDGEHLAAVYVDWEDIATHEKLDWLGEEPIREFEAYFVQLIFSVLAVRWIARR